VVYIHVAYALVMMDRYSFSIGCKVRGHHVYKEIWDPTIGEVMPGKREVGNSEDPLAVAMKRDRVIVGHLPRTISSTWICSVFLR